MIPALHMGALHSQEQALVLALAFGPFLLLVGVVTWRRRQDELQERLAAAERDGEDVGDYR